MYLTLQVTIVILDKPAATVVYHIADPLPANLDVIMAERCGAIAAAAGQPPIPKEKMSVRFRPVLGADGHVAVAQAQPQELHGRRLRDARAASHLRATSARSRRDLGATSARSRCDLGATSARSRRDLGAISRR